MLGDCVRLVDYMFQAMCSCDLKSKADPSLVSNKLDAGCMKAFSHNHDPAWQQLLFPLARAFKDIQASYSRPAP